MGDLASFVQKHPAVIGAAVVLVALIAWLQSRNQPQVSTDGGDITFTGGGVHSGAVDPGVVAMEEARIAAGSQNVGTIASLLLGERQSSDSLDAIRTQSTDSLTADLARTSANLTASLSQTEAQRQESLAQTDASMAIASQQVSAQTIAAQLTAQTQAAITAANLKAAQLQADTENWRIQAAKDEARAADNTSIVNGIVNVVGGIVSVLSFGFF